MKMRIKKRMTPGEVEKYW